VVMSRSRMGATGSVSRLRMILVGILVSWMREGWIVGTVTIQEVGDMCVLNWAIQGGTFTGDIAVKGGPSSFVYRYNGIQGRYPPLSPAEP